MTNYAIAIVGATGMVGTTLLSLLEERHFPVGQLHLLASQQSAGKSIDFKGKAHAIEDLATFDFGKTQYAFFCVGNDLAAKYIPIAVAAGNTVIDKSFFYRNNDAVPLIVPEVNITALKQYKSTAIIANPNCNTIPLAVGLKPIYDAVGIARINVATYQSVSGTGKDAITELTDQTRQLLDNKPVTHQVYPQQIAFNVLPHIDEFQENGYTREEMKVVWEMQKIFNDKTIAINPTAVRVPVYYGHSAAVHIETRDPISVGQALSLLRNAPGVKMMEGREPYPTPVVNAAGSDAVYIGRLRKDISHSHGLNLWIVADNLRKGAALNAIQIVEHLTGVESKS